MIVNKSRESLGKVEPPQKTPVNSSPGHQHNGIGPIRRNMDRHAAPKQSFAAPVLYSIKLRIEGDHLDLPPDAADRPVDPNISVESLVVYILDHEPHLFVYHAVRASIDRYLLQLPMALGQVLAPPLQDPLGLDVLPAEYTHGESGVAED